ncbi:hypothetical protein NQZ79_g942 [Umbelopsis isabellina]|nr:hypothetical protein NQZ79_g942 [Umbelopsis isabellina]
MSVYDWAAVKDSICSQARDLNVTLPQDLFYNQSFFGKDSVGASLRFFRGVDAEHRSCLLISCPDAALLCDVLSTSFLGDTGKFSLAYLDTNFSDIESCPITDAKQLSKISTQLKKRNKAAQRLNLAISNWKSAIELVKAKNYVFISFDIETYEMDHKIILELGWSMYDSKKNKFLDQHYINSAYRSLSNGRFVDDQKLRFLFGVSIWATLDQMLREFRKDLDWCIKRDGGYILVGHGIDSDIKFLRKQNFRWPSLTQPGPDTLDVKESAFVAILDTETIYGAHCKELGNTASLGRALDNIKIDSWCLHNAGNDAHYTMELFLNLCKLTPP